MKWQDSSMVISGGFMHAAPAKPASNPLLQSLSDFT